MSDGREGACKEQEERRKWEEERKDPRRDPDDRERSWESRWRGRSGETRAPRKSLDAAVRSESRTENTAELSGGRRCGCGRIRVLPLDRPQPRKIGSSRVLCARC